MSTSGRPEPSGTYEMNVLNENNAKIVAFYTELWKYDVAYNTSTILTPKTRVYYWIAIWKNRSSSPWMVVKWRSSNISLFQIHS